MKRPHPDLHLADLHPGRHSDSRPDRQRIISILHEVEEGTPVDEACDRAGISLLTYYRWRRRFGGLSPALLKRLRELEQERMERACGTLARLSLERSGV